MSSITRHTTRRLSHCYWRFELRAHRALCLESRVLSGARDDVGSLDSFAGGCAAEYLSVLNDLSVLQLLLRGQVGDTAREDVPHRQERSVASRHHAQANMNLTHEILA
uniref:SFRICE_014962 n=1 Tax=Spodoptera frugiperda TaxID=7108 RepID=A0A2H1WDL5_SPOFR